MKKIITFLALISLIGCSQYKDSKLLCSGDIEKEVSGQKSSEKNQYVILKIKDDSIRVSKNNKVFKEWVRVCDKGSNPLATKDQIYFNVKSCEANEAAAGLIFEGTYNFNTKNLHLKQKDSEETFTGNFTCETANLSQSDYKAKQ
jgi:hypothetical protein